MSAMHNTENNHHVPHRIGAWLIDPLSRTATNGTVVRRLSPRAVGVLYELIAADGAPLSRRDLLDRIWPNVTVGDESLTQAIAELRRTLKEGAHSIGVIETIPKVGYRLRVDAVAAQTFADMPTPQVEQFDLNAYKLCLDARTAMNRGDGNVVRIAETLTAEAVRMAPAFAFAHAEYAIALCYRWLYQRDVDDAIDTALMHAETATRLRPESGRGYAATALALSALGKNTAAIKALENGLRVDANDADLHFLGARVMFAARDHTCAAALAERASQLSTEDYWALYFAVRATAAFDPPRSRRLASECLARVRARLLLDPTEARALNLIGPLMATLGKHDEAVNAVMSQSADWSTLRFYDVVAFAQSGQHHLAFDTLSELIDNGWRHGDWLMAEPAFDEMRREPAFARKAAKLRAA